MSQKSNPMLVGVFVLGAFVLSAGGLLIFGGGGLLVKKDSYVVFFQGSVAGLQVGAPVNFRGVPLGEVTDITVSYFPEDARSEFLIPVYIEIEPERIRGRSEEDQLGIGELIELGLRAELALQSLVTGQLGIELDFRPETPALLVGLDPKRDEIPTLPSDTEKLKASITKLVEILQDVPLEQVANNIETAVTSASGSIVRVSTAIDAASDTIVPLADEIYATVGDARATLQEAKSRLSMQEGEVFYSASQTLAQLRAVIEDLGGRIGPLSQETNSTMIAMKRTIEDVETLVAGLQGEVDPISGGLKETLATADETLKDARRLLKTLDDNAGPLVSDAETTLEAVSELMSSARMPIESVGRLAAMFETEIGPLASEAQIAMESVGPVLENAALAINDLRSLIASVDSDVHPLFLKADETLDNASLAMREASTAVAGVRSLVEPNSTSVSQLNAALTEIRRAAMSLREFADFLERNPSALLTGRR